MTQTQFRSCLSIPAFLTLVAASLSAQPDQATVPLIVEGNRPFVELTLRKGEEAQKSVRFLVDTGGGGFLITEPVARELGLQWGTTQREEGKEFGEILEPPQALLGQFPLKLNPNRVLVMIAADSILPTTVPGRAEGMLPGHVLARYHVVFDYPAGKFTMANPGILKPEGPTLPMPVSKKSGFPQTLIEIEGEQFPFLLDTGASFTMVSERVLETWGKNHQNWERHKGAFGEAKWLGGQTLETMFVPQVRWGPNILTQVGVTSQREGTFEKFMSSMTKEPIVGALAGNVLKQFRIELDYKSEMLYLSKP